MKTMAEGSPAKTIFRFSLPLIVGGVFQQAYNMIDTVIIGRYLGENEIAGVGSTGVMFFFITSFLIGICNGSSVVISQYFGMKDEENTSISIISMGVVLGGLTVMTMLVGTFFCASFLKILQVPSETLQYAKDYLQVLFLFCGGNVLYNGTSAMLRSVGNTRVPLYALIVASILNVLLDYLLIVNAGMGVRGAAVATVVSQFISGCICLIYGICNRHDYGINFNKMKVKKKMIGNIIRVGVPVAFQSAMISIGGLCVQKLINSFGVDVLAAYTMANKIDNMAIQVICSFGTGLSVFTGQNMGLKKYDRIRQGLRATFVMNVVSAMIIAALAFLYGEFIMNFFLGDNATAVTVKEGATYLRVMGIAYLVCGIMQSYQNVIRGAGDSNTCMVAGIAELVGRIFFAYLLAARIGAVGIWIATPISWACGCVVPVVRYYSGNWKKKSVITEG